jgi:hypothetical protein
MQSGQPKQKPQGSESPRAVGPQANEESRWINQRTNCAATVTSGASQIAIPAEEFTDERFTLVVYKKDCVIIITKVTYMSSVTVK